MRILWVVNTCVKAEDKKNWGGHNFVNFCSSNFALDLTTHEGSGPGYFTVIMLVGSWVGIR